MKNSSVLCAMNDLKGQCISPARSCPSERLQLAECSSQMRRVSIYRAAAVLTKWHFPHELCLQII